MRGNDPLIEVLERNHDLIVKQQVLVLGEINSPQLMKLLVPTASATVVTDNYVTATNLAAVMGQRLGHSCFEVASYKHIKVIYAAASDPRLPEEIGPVERVLVFVAKTKTLNQHLLYTLQHKFHTNNTPAKITLIGANDAGGKSADGLVKGVASVYKHDSARKCTVFEGSFDHYEASGVGLKDCKLPKEVTVDGLTLSQEPGLFSQGELDGGTALLLKAVKDDLTNPEGPILDLGCGSGVIGLTLAKMGCDHVVCTDISATALYATQRNAKHNQLEVTTLACDMLPSAEQLTELHLPQSKFKYIVTNPPFHQGIARSLKETQAMIAAAPQSLCADGALYLVGNTCLNYGANLREAFAQVKELIATPKFTVFKATLA